MDFHITWSKTIALLESPFYALPHAENLLAGRLFMELSLIVQVIMTTIRIKSARRGWVCIEMTHGKDYLGHKYGEEDLKGQQTGWT